MTARAAMRRHFDDGDSLCQYVKEETGDTVVLSFSRGKDSLAALCQLRKHFGRIVPFYFELIPGGLRIENEDIARWEDVLGCEVYRYLHPGVPKMLRECVYQPPGRWEDILAMDLPRAYSKAAIEADVRARAKCPEAFVAVGVRAADSLNRRSGITRSGALNPATQTFFPVFDWDIARVEREIRAYGQPLPADYRLFGRSLEGLDLRYTVPLREAYPDDYETLRAWFPLIDLDTFRTTARHWRTA